MSQPVKILKKLPKPQENENAFLPIGSTIQQFIDFQAFEADYQKFKDYWLELQKTSNKLPRERADAVVVARNLNLTNNEAQ